MTFALGKLEPKLDPRTLDARAYMSAEPPPPSYTFDSAYATPFPLIDQGPTPDCTIASAANVQMRFEEAERRKYLAPRKAAGAGAYPDLLALYNRIAQPGGGAYLLDALKLWRTDGLPLAAATKKGGVYQAPTVRAKVTPYRIAGFAAVGLTPDQLRAAIWQFKLVQIGLAVTQHMESGASIVVEPQADDQVLGGHAMAVIGYVPAGLVMASTWGWPAFQVLSWAYVQQYVDECFALVDASDTVGQTIDRAALLADVAAVTR